MAAAMKNAIYVGMIAPTTAVISAAIIAVITAPTAALITTATTETTATFLANKS